MSKNPLVEYRTIPMGQLGPIVADTVRVQFADDREVAKKLEAAGVNVEKLIRSIANNAAFKLQMAAVEEQDGEDCS